MHYLAARALPRALSILQQGQIQPPRVNCFRVAHIPSPSPRSTTRGAKPTRLNKTHLTAETVPIPRGDAVRRDRTSCRCRPRGNCPGASSALRETGNSWELRVEGRQQTTVIISQTAARQVARQVGSRGMTGQPRHDRAKYSTGQSPKGSSAERKLPTDGPEGRRQQRMPQDRR